MTNNQTAMIIDGTLLVKENTLLPEPASHDTISIGNGWARITNSPAFQKKLAAARWTLFYMAGTIGASVLGFDRNRMTETAVKRLLANVMRQNCNCIEIDHIAMRSILGLPIVNILAHTRHLQQEHSFFGVKAQPR